MRSLSLRPGHNQSQPGGCGCDLWTPIAVFGKCVRCRRMEKPRTGDKGRGFSGSVGEPMAVGRYRHRLLGMAARMKGNPLG
jgi:hypothetical protein